MIKLYAIIFLGLFTIISINAKGRTVYGMCPSAADNKNMVERE